VKFREIDDDRLEAWALLLQTHSTLLASLERELVAEHGLPLTWYEVLLRLINEPGGAMRMQDLARSVLLSKSGVTRVVDRMEEAGLVERRTCTVDRRGTYATVTSAGRAAFRKAMPVHLTGIGVHFGRHLSDDDTRVLREALGRILRAHNAKAEEACTDGADASVAGPDRRREPIGAAARR
jgi:DNA-binding MarR family transcriptional regulator